MKERNGKKRTVLCRGVGGVLWDKSKENQTSRNKGEERGDGLRRGYTLLWDKRGNT